MKHTLLAAIMVFSSLSYAADPKTETPAKPETTKAKPAAKKGKPMFANFETSMGNFKVKFFTDKAPKTVENFVSLAEGTVEWTNPKTQAKGKTPLYNGTVFHRVIKNFMIQGGDPMGNGTGGPKGANWPFADEVNNGLSHSKAGILSMANAGPGTNGSQFFVTLVPTNWLDNKHTIFGEVVEGMEVVNKIGTTKTGAQDRPVEDVVLKKVTIIRE